MRTIVNVRLKPEDAAKSRAVSTQIARKLSVKREEITDLRIRRESIDARRRQVYVDRTYEVYLGERAEQDYARTQYQDCARKPQVIVVGAGPAGLFAALRLLEVGLKPVIIERGKSVEQRKLDIAKMGRSGVVNPDSNYGFGEGGAGAFSDGKLFTRSDKRGDVAKVLSQFCQHGADPAILYETHPHIGSDRLPGVIQKIRATIQNNGGEFHFQSKVVALEYASDGAVAGVVTESGKTYEGPVILAVGHSASELFRYLDGQGIAIQSKGVAVGVRLEHPQELVDQIQYHCAEGRGKYLPPADYWFVTQAAGRGVYSFCMCPGGVIVPSCTRTGYLSVNGMSSSARSGRFANSGMVVELRPEDLSPKQFGGHLAMLDFVEAFESHTWKMGGGKMVAPAQRMGDFLQGHLSETLPQTSYYPGIASADMDAVLPRFISTRLKTGFEVFGRKAKGFLTNEALLVACESRTSSPVRIPRDETSLMHVGRAGLFPCGEGAGYAGGIVSAALDGIACADAVARYCSR